MINYKAGHISYTNGCESHDSLLYDDFVTSLTSVNALLR